MNNRYKQLGKIFLGETKKGEGPGEQGRRPGQTAAGYRSQRGRARANLKFTGEHTPPPLRAEAPRRAVPPGTTTTTRKQAKEAMRRDPKRRPAEDPPSPNESIWTTYHRLGKLLSESPDKPTEPKPTSPQAREAARIEGLKNRMAQYTQHAKDILAAREKGEKHPDDEGVETSVLRRAAEEG